MFPDQSRLPSPSVCALLVSGPLYKLRAGNTKAPVFMKCNHVIFLPLGLEVTAFHWFPLSFSSNAMKTLRVHPENSLFFQFPYTPSHLGCSHPLTHTYICTKKRNLSTSLIHFRFFDILHFLTGQKQICLGPLWLEDVRREDNSLHSSVYHRQINAKWEKNNQTKNVMSIKFRPS